VSGGDAYVRTLSWLYAREAQAGIDLKLARVAVAAERLGHPERAAPALHVGGTNGKGSTAAMLDAMLRAGGRRVGLYTSPHLVSFRERIVVGGELISEDEVVDGVARLRRDLDDARGLTAFEIMTLLAWLTFAARAVEVQVLEVGLGGRLDATNVVAPEAVIITNVGRDHEAFLGDTIAAIAGEKAGIVKPDTPIVSGAHGEAAAVIADRAAALASPLSVLDRDFSLTPAADGTLLYRSPSATIDHITLALRGAHQRANAALALRALELAVPLGADALRAGLATTAWPGRLQLVRRAPDVLLDGAHNPAGIDVLVEEMRVRAAGRRIRVLIGVMHDKNWPPMLRALARITTDLVVTRPRQTRSADPRLVAADSPIPARVVEDPAQAYEEVLAVSRPDDVVLATGSLFLVGDLLAVIDPAYAAAAARERAAVRLTARA